MESARALEEGSLGAALLLHLSLLVQQKEQLPQFWSLLSFTKKTRASVRFSDT